MFRVLCINSYQKAHVHLHISLFFHKKSLGVCFNETTFPRSYSALPKYKTNFKQANSSKRKKVKLKIKPYEELLKVLEVREEELKKNCNELRVNKEPKTASKELSNEYKSILETKNITLYNNDLCFNEGVYSVNGMPEKWTKKSNKNELPKEKKKKSQSKAIKNKSKAMEDEKKKDLKIIIKHSNAIKTLKSYVEVSINAKEVENAQEVFEYHKEKYKLKSKAEQISDIGLYNLLMSGWAQKGRSDKIKYIFSLMRSDELVPNLQSYAAYLECISRDKLIDLSEVQNILNEMKLKGFTAKDMLETCTFVGDQREKILEVLGFVEKDLRISSFLPEKPYSCKLLENLNNNSFERTNNHFNFGFQEQDIERLSISQMEMENAYTLKIKSVDVVTGVDDKILKSRKYLKECEDMWRKKLTVAVKNIKNLEKKTYDIHHTSMYPYLAVIDIEILVNLLLQEIRMLAETCEYFSPCVKVLYKDLGIKIMNHYFIWLKKKNKVSDKVLFIYKKYLEYLLDPKLYAEYSPREYWEFLKNKYSDGPTIDVPNVVWPYSTLTYIGKYMYDILRNNISFNANCVRRRTPSKVMSQAFYTAYEGLDVKLSKQIRTHSLLCKLYRDAKLEYLYFNANLVPMLSPPHPWVKHDSGGLLITATHFVRFPDQAQHQVGYYSKVPSQQLNPCFDSLNNLSLCPWIINKPILDMVIDVFQKGGSEELDIPLNPSNFGSVRKIHPSMTKSEKTAIHKQRMQLKKKKGEAASLWYDCLYKLSIANDFRDKVFWFPHNLDFRGRVYPTPPHFNHLGSDMARSILLFAEGQPLGKNGLNWLKIHLINLTGFKKRDPHAERLKFANEMLPEILDSANHPFNGRQWWKTSDKPWQTLACCKEVANALKHPNPEEYVSHFPVHQDGSCNGLQHYAALGRDELGAIEVNLHPSSSPQDVYSGVAAIIEKERQKDAASGLEIAKSLEGFVTRKVVKQTVMTFVYGVTTYGAKLQILKQLKDIPEFPEKNYHEGATYLMKKTFFSIREMFTATKQIQDWFTDCAEQITRVSGNTLEWVTPLGLPVIQPYHKEASVRSSKFCISKGKESESHYQSNFEPYQQPNIRKQKNAFAPNFIHSLDSSHMMLTSLFCQRRGIAFVSVHDCFWTHASSVEIMNKVCREQFVILHSEPILENLSAFFLEKYASVADENVQTKSNENSARLKLKDIVTRVPNKGTFDLRKVLKSEYFFS